jgi:putative ABC transport system permease protein
MRLLRALILRPLGRDRTRTALSVVSVALGVAVVVAIELAGEAATGSFQSSVETLAGRTDLEIVANGGVDERWMGVLAALPVDARFSPRIERQAVVRGVGAVPVYGVDMVGGAVPGGGEAGRRGAGGAVVSRALASRLGVGRGGAVNAYLGGSWRQVTAAAIVDAGAAEFVALDIADMEQAIGRFGKLDRIDVAVAPDEDFARVEAAVRSALPQGYLVAKPGLRSEENQRMVRAFRWNLRVLSYISLVVGAFLIYNTVAMSVVRRRAEIGVLRALGAGRWAVLRLFLGEALLLGLAGAVLGVGLGRALAGGIVSLISLTVNALYATSRPAPVELTWLKAAAGVMTGAVVALVSAWAPAREAMDVAPTEAMGRGAHEHHARLRWRRGLAWAVALAALAAAASQARPVAGFPAGGYGAAFLAIAAAAMAAPALVLGVHRATGRLIRRNLVTMLAGRSLAASLARTSVVVAALATAIAMMASVGVMVGSFRETVLLWLENQFRADFYVAAMGAGGAGEFTPLPAGVASVIESTPGVDAVDTLRAAPFHFRGERATLAAHRTELLLRFGGMRFRGGPGREAILGSLPGRDRAIVSEPFANKHGLKTGDRIDVALGEHKVMLEVAGVYYDYSSSQGWVIVDSSTLEKYLPGQPPTSAAVYAVRGADAERVRRELQLRTAGLGVAITSNRQLRQISMTIFDRTFAITWALEGVAIVVAMLGAANALLALVLDRRRELGLLRYLGASGGQVRGLVLVEAGYLGLLAAALGLALGLALSLLLVFVVNRQSFGWTIQFHPPIELLAGAVALVVLVTVSAGVYPARVAARLNPIDVIHEE